ncbi:ATP-binding protein [Streptomyces sp. NPDC051555]|uniref:ATP-binding protein n=1 Tax=Streptomyces sp. NPDC051555 TaxID=3365657 RepID=UPI0037A5814B
MSETTNMPEPDSAGDAVPALEPGTVALLWAMDRDPLAQSASSRLPQTAQSVGLARRFVTELLTQWECSEDIKERACLAVSELTTNAVVHAPSSDGCPGEVLVGLSFAPNVALVVYVADRSSTTLPLPRIVGPGSEHGRGLSIVTEVADGWGYWPRSDGTGKHVAAHFALTAA